MNGCIERLWFSCGCFILLFYSFLFPAWATPEISLTPSTYTAEVAEEWLLSVQVANVKDLYSVVLELSFEPASLQIIHVNPGDFLTDPSAGSSSFLYTIHPDQIRLAMAAPIGHPGVSGSGTIATIRFSSFQQGRADLSISPDSLILSDTTGTPITDAPQIRNTSIAIGRGVVLDHETATVGNDITAYLTGFSPGEMVTAQLGEKPLSLSTNMVDAAGRLQTTFELPPFTGGEQQIRFHGEDSGWDESVPLGVMPSIQMIQPNQAKIGSRVQVQVHGFGAEETIIVELGTVMLILESGSHRSDEFGSANLSFSIPTMPVEGNLPIKISGLHSGLSVQQQEALRILPEITQLMPTQGSIGTSIEIMGHGFGANEPISVQFSGEPVEATSDADGRWQIVFLLQSEQIAESRYGVLPCVAIGLRSDQRATRHGFVYEPLGRITSIEPSGEVNVGDTIEFQGEGFPAGALVGMLLNDRPVTQFRDTQGNTLIPPVVPSNGVLHFLWDVPTIPAGIKNLTLTVGSIRLERENAIAVVPSITSVLVKDGTDLVTTGRPGMLATASGEGFTANHLVVLDMGAHVGVATVQADAYGHFEAPFVLRDAPPGNVLITANDGVYTVTYRELLLSVPESPTFYLSTTSGHADEIVRIVGTGFPPSINLGTLGLDSIADEGLSPQFLLLMDARVGYTTGSQIITDGRGAFDMAFSIPRDGTEATYGDKEVWLFTTTEGMLSQPLHLEPHLIVQPSEAAPGQTVQLYGTGFAPNEPINLGFGESGAETVITDPILADSSGSWSVSFTIPNQPGGLRRFQAKGGTSQQNRYVEFSVIPQITQVIKRITNESPGSTLSPGDTVEIAGNGFGANEQIQIDLGEARNVLITGEPGTGSLGDFSTAFLVPNQRSLSPEVRARVIGLDSGFVAESPVILYVAGRLKLEPQRGFVGTWITVLTSDMLNTVYFAGQSLPIQQFDALGHPMFQIPTQLPGGSYVIEAGEASTIFEVIPRLTLAQGQTVVVGTSMQIRGTGFDQYELVSFGTGWLEQITQSVTDQYGQFNTSMIIPPQPGGWTLLYASGTSSFITQPLNISPKIVTVQSSPSDATLLIAAEGYGVQETVQILLDGVTSLERDTTMDGLIGVSIPFGAISSGTAHSVQIRGLSSGLVDVWRGTWYPTTARLEVASSVATLGSFIQIRGFGFSATEPLRLLIGDRVFNTATSAAGSFDITYSIQKEFASGMIPIHALGRTSHIQAFHPGFTYISSVGPRIVSVIEDSSGKILTVGDTLTIYVTQGEDATPAERGYFRIGPDIEAPLYNDGIHGGDVQAGDAIWTGQVVVRSEHLAVENTVWVELADAAEQTAQANSNTTVQIDAIAQITSILVPDKILSDTPISIEVTAEIGGTATCQLEGFIENVPLKEEELGIYRAEVQITSAETSNTRCIVTFEDALGNQSTSQSDPILVDTSAQIKEVSVSGSPALPGESITITLLAEPGGEASYRIPTLISERPLEEVLAGQYVGEYLVPQGTPYHSGILEITFTDAYEHTATDASEQVILGVAARQFTVETTLYRGLNLVSLPLQVPEIQTLSDWMAHIGPETSSIVWYDNNTERFRTIIKGQPAEPVQIKPGVAYFIFVDANVHIIYRGQPYEGDVSLLSGMNMLGVPLQDERAQTIQDLASLLGDATLIIRYNRETELFESYTPSISDQRIGSHPITGTEGFIVLMSSARTILFEGDVWQ